MTEKISITDTTGREGDQAPFTCLNKEEKAIIALMLAELGVDTIEAGFAASAAEKENENIQYVVKALGENYKTYISSLGMATLGNTEDSITALNKYKYPRIHIFIATSDDHIKAKFCKDGKSLEEGREFVLQSIVEQIKKAKKFKEEVNSNLEIEISPEAASNNAINKDKVLDLKSEQFEFLVKFVRKAITTGANIINIPDTLGNLLPWEIEEVFRKLIEKTEDLKSNYDFKFSCHVHNDLASATQNSIGAVRGGARVIETTICGIGERTGNASLHEILGILTEKSKSIIPGKEIELLNIQTHLIGPISRFVERLLNLNKNLQTPFIGGLSDVDGSGVHNASQSVYGGTKEKSKYGGEILEPFFSPRGGRNQIYNILKEYGIYEDLKSDIIKYVTDRACLIAEESKALYYPNIYALYMKEKGNFEFEQNDIIIEKDIVRVKMTIFGEQLIIEHPLEGGQGAIDGIIKGINKFLGKDIIDINDINVINKPSIKEEINRLYSEIPENVTGFSSYFKEKVKEIIGKNGDGNHSEQKGISHIKMSSRGKNFSSVSFGYDVTKNNISAIIYGALEEIVKKVKEGKKD